MLNKIIRASCALLVLVVMTSSVWGTDLIGRRVRVTAPGFSADVIEGSVASAVNDTLRLVDCRPSLDLQIISVSTVTRLQVFDGHKRHTLTGAAIGAGAGLAIWGIAELSSDPPKDGFLEGLDEALSRLFLVIFTCGGAVTGGIVGTCIESDRWREVPKEKLQVTLVPIVGKQVGLSLAIRF